MSANTPTANAPTANMFGCETRYLCKDCISKLLNSGKHNCKQCTNALAKYHKRLCSSCPTCIASHLTGRSRPAYNFFQFFKNDLVYVVSELDRTNKVGAYSPSEHEWFSFPDKVKTDFEALDSLVKRMPMYNAMRNVDIFFSAFPYEKTEEKVSDEVAKTMSIYYTTKYQQYHSEVLEEEVCDKVHEILGVVKANRTLRFVNGIVVEDLNAVNANVVHKDAGDVNQAANPDVNPTVAPTRCGVRKVNRAEKRAEKRA